MDMSSLFPAEAMEGVLDPPPVPHISFKAGLLRRDPATNMVTADARKGIFQIATLPADGLMHLQWRPRNTQAVEQDLIIFNGEATMAKVNSCAEGARVYVLKWREAGTRMFFWMQERDPSKDAENISTVNNILAHGPDQQQPTEESAHDQPDPIDLLPTLNAHDSTPDQRTSTENEATPAINNEAPPNASGEITLEQFQQMLAALPSRAAVGSQSADAQRELIMSTPGILDIVGSDEFRSELTSPEMQQRLPALLELLPEQDRSISKLNSVLRSAPFLAQASALTTALRSAQSSELLRSFGLEDAEAHAYGLRAFLDALLRLERE